MTLPLVVILDWDGTIAGNVEYQAAKHSISLLLKNNGFKINNKNSKAFYPSQKLIRKGFKDFIETLEQLYNNNIYFFIYTASDPIWAQKEISWVEKIYDIKFQRPLFTRKDCVRDNKGVYIKSLNRIFPRIIRSINKNMKNNLTKYQTDFIYDRNTLIIDNTMVYEDNLDKLLLCPDYNYTIFEDIMEDVPSKSLQNHRINLHVKNLINSDKVYFSENTKNMNKLLHQKHSWITSKIESIMQSNKKYTKDNFFPQLTSLIVKNKFTNFNPKIVNKLQKLSGIST